jgi:hypothetical protein
MHEQSALGDRLLANATTWQFPGLANGFRLRALETKLGRVVQNENWPLRGGDARLRRRKMAGQEDAFVDARGCQRIGKPPS